MAVDMFMKIDDVKGESADKAHKGEIDVLSWSWGATQTGSAQVGGGTGTGKAQVHDLSFTMHMEKSSPVLLGMVLQGKPFKKAVLTLRKAGGSPLEFLKITMNNGLVSSVSKGCDQATTSPSQTVTLNFASVQFDYTPQKSDGTADATVTTGFDIAGNASL